MAVEEEPKQQEYAPKKKKSDEEYEKRKKNITPGSLLKAMIRSGEGTSKPVEGDQVIFHCTIRTVDGVTVNSTRSEHGGKGYPNRYIMGKSKMLLGLCEGIPTMLKGEVAMFKVKPELHYAEVDCPITAPEDFPKDVELHFEIEMLDFFKAKIVSEDMGVVKKMIDEGQGWECPREPYEVEAWITAKAVDGKLILPCMEEPYYFTFGKSEIPKGLEMGIGMMAKGEKAVIFVNNSYLTKSSLMQIPEILEEVWFEVELLHFIQVRDMLGDGRLVKRRIHDGKDQSREEGDDAGRGGRRAATTMKECGGGRCREVERRRREEISGDGGVEISRRKPEESGGDGGVQTIGSLVIASSAWKLEEALCGNSPKPLRLFSFIVASPSPSLKLVAVAKAIACGITRGHFGK